MKLEVEVPIKAPKEKVWQTITDFDSAADRISGIEKIEILEKPESGLIGFKWRETRTMFGKTATEEMWITDVLENDHYNVRAESHGAIYRSTMSVAGEGNQSVLKMTFDAESVSFGAKVMSFLMGFMFNGATRKALQKDLGDIKASVESSDK